jgi:hypothetical protein
MIAAARTNRGTRGGQGWIVLDSRRRSLGPRSREAGDEQCEVNGRQVGAISICHRAVDRVLLSTFFHPSAGLACLRSRNHAFMPSVIRRDRCGLAGIESPNDARPSPRADRNLGPTCACGVRSTPGTACASGTIVNGSRGRGSRTSTVYSAQPRLCGAEKCNRGVPARAGSKTATSATPHPHPGSCRAPKLLGIHTKSDVTGPCPSPNAEISSCSTVGPVCCDPCALSARQRSRADLALRIRA